MMTKAEKKKAILDRQFQMAMEGSIEMLKWVGINLCGQSNKPDMSEDELPMGFNVGLIVTRGQKEYEENKEEFLKWKEGRDD